MANCGRVHGSSSRAHVLRVAALVVLTTAALAAFTAPAAEAGGKDCAHRVIDDWYDNYRVDSTIYEEHCYRAAVELLGIDLRDYGSAEDDILRALSYARRGELDPGDGSGPPVAPAVAASPSSVPLPLIILGALGLLLLAAGSAGYLKRRFGGGDPPTST